MSAPSPAESNAGNAVPASYGPPPSVPPTSYWASHPEPGSQPGYFAPAPAYPPPPPWATTKTRPTPGQALASWVLSYVLAALLLIGAFLLFEISTFIDSLADTFGSHDHRSTELVADGVVNCVLAVLLITSAVLFTNRVRFGRWLVLFLSIAVLGDCAYWIVRTHQLAWVWGWSTLFGAFAIIIGLLTVWPSVGDWLRPIEKDPLSAR